MYLQKKKEKVKTWLFRVLSNRSLNIVENGIHKHTYTSFVSNNQYIRPCSCCPSFSRQRVDETIINIIFAIMNLVKPLSSVCYSLLFFSFLFFFLFASSSLTQQQIGANALRSALLFSFSIYVSIHPSIYFVVSSSRQNNEIGICLFNLVLSFKNVHRRRFNIQFRQ